MRGADVYTFDYEELITDTLLAWLLLIEHEKIWFPKSQCEMDERCMTVNVPFWLAKAKNLI